METKKFSFSGLIANSSNGEPSSGKFGGLWLFALGSIIVLMGAIYGIISFKHSEVFTMLLNIGLGLFTLGSGLIASKIFKPTKNVENNDVN